MGATTSIEWTDATWNPVGGCSIKSPGCINCYAQRLCGTRLKAHPLYAGTTTLVKDKPVFNGKMTAAPNDDPVWTWPLRWRGAKQPKLGTGKPSLIFVGDMSDLFHEDRPLETIDRTMAVAQLADNHIFQLLTKRADRMRSYFDIDAPWRVWMAMQKFYPEASDLRWNHEPPFLLPNVWLGFSAERQQEFDERWEHMRPLAEAGWTIFVSIEPALGPVILPPDFLKLGRRAQVIFGGESGPDARVHHIDWSRSLRRQCLMFNVAFFYKQWGEWCAEGQEQIADYGGCEGKSGAVVILDYPVMHRVGRKVAGRLLDGQEHSEFPT